MSIVSQQKYDQLLCGVSRQFRHQVRQAEKNSSNWADVQTVIDDFVCYFPELRSFVLSLSDSRLAWSYRASTLPPLQPDFATAQELLAKDGAVHLRVRPQDFAVLMLRQTWPVLTQNPHAEFVVDITPGDDE